MLNHKWQCILYPIIATALVALLANTFTDTSSLWYQSLIKPEILPPPIIVSIVWAIIYSLCALSAIFVCISEKEPVTNALYLYGVNGALNALWTYLFFEKHLLVSSLVCLALLLLSTATLTRYVKRIENVASLLLLPYLLWLIYTLALNYAVAMLN